MLRRGLLVLLAVALTVATTSVALAAPLTLWHAYRGEEREALDQLAEAWNHAHPDAPLTLLALPYEAYATKLASAIPNGNGPDLFIFAHERVGEWSRSGLIAETEFADVAARRFLSVTLDALRFEGKTYGWPLAFKSLALFVHPELLPQTTCPETAAAGSVEDCTPEPIIPATTDALLKLCRRSQADKRFALAYESGSFYHHAPWLFGFGGGVFDAEGRVDLDTPENARSLAFAAKLVEEGCVPEESTGSLVTQLFNERRAVLAINGPWFLGELDPTQTVRVAPLPSVSETGRPATPFMTVEAVFLSAYAANPEDARRVAEFLALGEGARRRALTGRQAVADRTVADLIVAANDDPLLSGFIKMGKQAVPMPNDPRMRAVWEPAAQALRQVLRGSATPEEALKLAQTRLKVLTRPRPQTQDPQPYLIALAVVLGILLLIGGIVAIRRSVFSAAWRSKTAYLYLIPTLIGMGLLVFVPFIVGTAVAFFAHRQGEFTFVGFTNFINILSSRDYSLDDPLSFYFTLGVTVLWTAVNVFLHVSVGLGLALLLRDPWMRLRGLYRVLLIVPWAVPNYITALIWKGLFNKQFGAVNGLIVWLGATLGLDIQPVSWFSHFWTSFAANVATNTWLGFPFMMVVTLGALQAIPRELEEAAEVDGAGPFTRFFHITLPLLRPALLPAVILGSVWTFNMFNIIYLVSGGEPDGASEILITEAYRWAFTRQEQYGYAAAYATLIFVVLLMYSRLTRRVVGGQEV